MHLLAFAWSGLLHPLAGDGYQFWSGIGSDFSELAVVVAAFAFLRHHNCHVRGCWRLRWHEHPAHGHPVCRKHHGEPATSDLSTKETL